MKESIQVLILEDNLSDARLIREYLKESGSVKFFLTHVERLEIGQENLKQTLPDVILLDLGLPDSQGLGSLEKIAFQSPGVPIIVLTGLNDLEMANKAMQAGAQDYLIKGEFNGELLIRAIHYSIERKQMENTLRMGEADLIKAQKVAHLGSWKWFIQTNQLEWSDEMFRIFGVDAKEFTGNLNDVMVRSIHPDDRPAVEAANRSVVEQKKPVALEYRIVLPDGNQRTVWAEAGELQLDKNGDPAVLSGIIQDITQRKQSEQLLHLQSAALEAAANAIVITDRDGSIQWSNPAWSGLTGYSAAEALGKNPRIMKSGVHETEFYKDLWETIQAGKVWHAEMVNKRKDGSLYTEDETITPLIDASGQVTHFIAVKQDITQRKQSERLLLEQAENLQERNAQLARLYRVSSAMITGTFLGQSDIGQVMVDTITQEFGEVCSCLYMLDYTKNEFVLAASSSAVSVQSLLAIIGLENAELFLQVVQNKKAIYRPDFQNHNNLALFLESTRSILVTPILLGDHVTGIIYIQSAQPDCFTSDDQQFLNLFANQAAIVLENANLLSETKMQLNRLESLRKIDETINASLDLKVTADVLLNQITNQLHIDAADLLVYDPGTMSLNFVSNLGFKTSALQFSNVRLGQGLAGHAANSRQILHITNLAEQENFHNASPLLNEEKFVEYYGVPLIAKGTLRGLLEIYNRSLHSTNDSWQSFLVALAGQAAIAMDNIDLFSNLQKSINELIVAYDESIEGWSHALDLRDNETEGHTQRVVKITTRLAKALGLHGEELVHVRRGGLLHDIGKMGIPDKILLKPGPLTDEEWKIMRLHPVYAFELLSPITFLKQALDIPYCHHEKWDGSGYPRGLKGLQIPLTARLFAVADVWDALTSDRPYRKAWPESQAIEYIREQAGKHFDPQIVELFLNSYLFESGSQVKPTILIVDDEENVTRSLARSLKDYFTVLTANNGNDALRIVQNSDPAVVLTDQRMPEMSGIELLEYIRKIKPATVGILISGYSDIIALTAAINLGNVHGFIPKPWDFDVLRGKLEEAVNNYRELVRGNRDIND